MIAFRLLVSLLLAAFVGALPVGDDLEPRACDAPSPDTQTEWATETKTILQQDSTTVVTSTTTITLPSGPQTTPSDPDLCPSDAETSPSDQTSVPLPSPSNTGSLPGQPNGNSEESQASYRNVLYYTCWTGLALDKIPADKVTHLLFAFVDVQPDGTVFFNATGCGGKSSTDSIENLFKVKELNRHMKTILSIGGYGYREHFKTPASTKDGRQNFATSAVQLMLDWGMDGLDIDWEYPEDPQQAADFVALLKACREELERRAKKHDGYHFDLTVASPAGPNNYRNMNLPGMDTHLDAWYLMAYDFVGGWDDVHFAGHQANLRPSLKNPQSTPVSAEAALEAYISQGIDSKKIVFGMPLYGRVFLGTEGPGSPYGNVLRVDGVEQTLPYKDISTSCSEFNLSTSCSGFDSDAGASYIYDSGKKKLITYDNVESAKNKAEYIASKPLGGAMYWEASFDRPGEDSIVGTVAAKLGSLDMSENWLSYPSSPLVNIRNRMA